jgi:hypothetical protein
MRVVPSNVGFPRTVPRKGREETLDRSAIVAFGLDALPDDRRSYFAKKLRDHGRKEHE